MTEAEWLVCDEPAKMVNPIDFSSRAITDAQLGLWVEVCRSVAGLGNEPDLETRLDRAVRVWAAGLSGTPPTRATRAAILRDIVGSPWRPVKVPRVGAILRGQKPDGFGGQIESDGYCPWFTPQVLSLARAAHEERKTRKCEHCHSTGRVYNYRTNKIPGDTDCWECHGTGTIPTVQLDRDRLLILADALEEAGCPVEEACPFIGPGSHHSRQCSQCNGTCRIPHPILAHLRGPGPHYRGCHVLKALLGEQ